MIDYPIGTKFQTRGKRKDICTVVDIHKTYNSAGELVKTRYVATHNFLGAAITDCDVVAVTIARGLVTQCAVCDGTGYDDSCTETQPCGVCDGAGVIEQASQTAA